MSSWFYNKNAKYTPVVKGKKRSLLCKEKLFKFWFCFSIVPTTLGFTIVSFLRTLGITSRVRESSAKSDLRSASVLISSPRGDWIP
jgi:hypothetical protein